MLFQSADGEFEVFTTHSRDFAFNTFYNLFYELYRKLLLEFFKKFIIKKIVGVEVHV